MSPCRAVFQCVSSKWMETTSYMATQGISEFCEVSYSIAKHYSMKTLLKAIPDFRRQSQKSSWQGDCFQLLFSNTRELKYERQYVVNNDLWPYNSGHKRMSSGWSCNTVRYKTNICFMYTWIFFPSFCWLIILNGWFSSNCLPEADAAMRTHVSGRPFKVDYVTKLSIWHR